MSPLLRTQSWKLDSRLLRSEYSFVCFACRQECCSGVIFRFLTFRFIQLFTIPLQKKWRLSRTVNQPPTCDLSNSDSPCYVISRRLDVSSVQFVKFKAVFIHQDKDLWPMIMRFTPSVRSFCDVASESCEFDWETMALSCPKVVRRAFPLSTLISVPLS